MNVVYRPSGTSSGGGGNTADGDGLMRQLDAISAAEKHHAAASSIPSSTTPMSVTPIRPSFPHQHSATVYHAHHHETLNAAQSLFISHVAISVALVFEFFKVIDA